MSLKDGTMAINLQMPDRVPRTEYSVERHWKLLEKVTGISINNDSPLPDIQAAQREFYKEWNYGINWNVCIHHGIFGDYYTDMGHASYEDGGTDMRNPGGCKFKDEEDVLNFDPYSALGSRDTTEIIKHFDNDYDEQHRLSPDSLSMTGIYVTCMSGLIDLLGWDMLLISAGVDSKRFGELANRYCDWILQYFKALALSKAPVVMVHDDIVWTEGAFLAPEWYRKYIFPNYKKLLAPLHEAGKKILFTSDGTYTEFIDDIADCGVNGFVMEPTTDMSYIAEKYGKTHSFIGNADTNILLRGTRDDIYAEVKRCMDIGKKYPGFILAVGNHIPHNTPIDNALWYNEFYNELSIR